MELGVIWKPPRSHHRELGRGEVVLEWRYVWLIWHLYVPFYLLIKRHNVLHAGVLPPFRPMFELLKLEYIWAIIMNINSKQMTGQSFSYIFFTVFFAISISKRIKFSLSQKETTGTFEWILLNFWCTNGFNSYFPFAPHLFKLSNGGTVLLHWKQNENKSRGKEKRLT